MTSELIAVADLKPHPKNYRAHPDDQLDHIVESIKLHGFYRNVVVSRDNTILAGHGVVAAAKKLGTEKLPVVRLDLDADEPRALKVLTGDNEIGGLGIIDDRALTEMLKSIKDLDGSLLGTGFDEQRLAALAFVTRPASEFASMNDAAAWLGMPAYEEGGVAIKLIVTFPTTEAREKFVADYAIQIDKSAIKGQTWSTRWPWTDREKNADSRFDETGAEPPDATAA